MFYNNYRDSVMKDVKAVIENEGIEIEGQDDIDELVFDFDVAGSRNGSYYCSREAAKESIKDAIFDTDVLDLLNDYDVDIFQYMQIRDYEAIDCIIRDAVLTSISWEDWCEYLDIKNEEI